MKTMLIILGTVAALVIGAFVLFPWAKDYVFQATDDIDRSFANKVRDERVLAKAEEEFGDIEEFLRSKYLSIVEAKRQLANQEGNRDSQAQKLAKEEDAIAKAGEWLETHGLNDKVVLDGQEYSHAMVAADARSRVGNCQGLRASIEALEGGCRIIRSSIGEGEAKIREALGQIQVQRDAMEAKKVQLAAFRAVEAAESIASGIQFEGSDVEQVSTRYLEELDRRITEVQGRRDFSQLAATSSGGTVPWTTSSAKQSDLDAVQAYVDQNMTPTPTPEAPASADPAPDFGVTELEVAPAQ